MREYDRKPFEALMLDYDHKAEVGEYVHNRLTAQQIEHIQTAYQHLGTWMN